MFDVHLTWFETSGEMGLKFPLGARITSLVIALVLGLASFTGGPPSLLGLGLTLLFVLGAVYEERWTFARSGEVAFRWGLWGLARTTRWDASQVEGLWLSAFRRGLVPGAQEETTGYRRGRPLNAVLTIHFTNGSSRVLERRPARHRTDLDETAQRLAEASGLSLARDSSW